jgi:hypothetical protein
LSVLRLTPFPPGSRSLRSDAAWYSLTTRFPGLQAFIYGTNHDAVVYTYDATHEVLTVQLAIVDGTIVPP